MCISSGYRCSTAEAERREACERLTRDHPGHIPVVVESLQHDRALLLALPDDTTVGELDKVVQQAFHVYRTSITVMGSASAPTRTTLVRQLYADYKDEDGFLYVVWLAAQRGESTADTNHTRS